MIARLDDFHNLVIVVIALEKVQENRHRRRFGHPTLLGSSRPLDEILEILTKVDGLQPASGRNRSVLERDDFGRKDNHRQSEEKTGETS